MNKDVIKQNTLKYMESEIKTVSNNFPYREAGSIDEINSIEYYIDIIDNFIDDKYIIKTPVVVQPRYYFGWAYFLAAFLIVATAVYFITPVFSIFTTIISVLPFIIEYIFNKPIFKHLYDPKESFNIATTYNSKNNPKKRVYIVSSSDAPHERILEKLLSKKILRVIYIISSIGMLYTLVLSIVASFYSSYGTPGTINNSPTVLLYLGIVQFIFIPFYLCYFMLFDGSKISPAVNRNLSSTALNIGILKYLKESNIVFDDTEIVSVIVTGKECGNQGIQAFIKDNLSSVKNSNIKSIVINFENLKDPNNLRLYKTDAFGFRKNDKSLIDNVVQSAKEIYHEIKIANNFLQPSNATEFSRKHVQATSIAGDGNSIPYTNLDNLDSLDMDCVEKAFDITIQTIKDFANN